MPRLSIVFIKSALLYLAAGFTLGGLILIQKGTSALPLAWRLLPAHIETLFFGWTLQLIMGTAFWILPRYGRAQKRGDERVVWFAYAALNAGILMAVFSPMLPESAWFLMAGRIAEGLGLAAYVLNAWPRIRPFAR